MGEVAVQRRHVVLRDGILKRFERRLLNVS
jgi:hypothetical protein